MDERTNSVEVEQVGRKRERTTSKPGWVDVVDDNYRFNEPCMADDW